MIAVCVHVGLAVSVHLDQVNQLDNRDARLLQT